MCTTYIVVIKVAIGLYFTIRESIREKELIIEEKEITSEYSTVQIGAQEV